MAGPRGGGFMRHWFAIEVRLSSIKSECEVPNSIISLRPSLCTLVLFIWVLQAPNSFSSYAIMAVAIGGGSWYLTRLARGPTSASSASLIAVSRADPERYSCVVEQQQGALELSQAQRDHEDVQRQRQARLQVRLLSPLFLRALSL